jgi:hypothetical protein
VKFTITSDWANGLVARNSRIAPAIEVEVDDEQLLSILNRLTD